MVQQSRWAGNRDPFRWLETARGLSPVRLIGRTQCFPPGTGRFLVQKGVHITSFRCPSEERLSSGGCTHFCLVYVKFNGNYRSLDPLALERYESREDDQILIMVWNMLLNEFITSIGAFNPLRLRTERKRQKTTKLKNVQVCDTCTVIKRLTASAAANMWRQGYLLME